GPQKEEAQIRGEDGGQVGVAPEDQDQGVAHGQEQDAGKEGRHRQELAHHHLTQADGAGEEQFRGPPGLLLGPKAHGEHGHDKDQNDGTVAEVAAQGGQRRVGQEQPEKVPPQGQEDGGHHVGEGGSQKDPELFPVDGAQSTHAEPSPASAGSCVTTSMKTSSRENRGRVSSRMGHWASARAKKMAGRASIPGRSSTCRPTWPPVSGSRIQTVATSGTCSSLWATAGAGAWTTSSRRPPALLALRFSVRSSATSRPRLMMITRWQRACTSGRMWELSKTVWEPASSRISSRISMICRG